MFFNFLIQTCENPATLTSFFHFPYWIPVTLERFQKYCSWEFHSIKSSTRTNFSSFSYSRIRTGKHLLNVTSITQKDLYYFFFLLFKRPCIYLVKSALVHLAIVRIYIISQLSIFIYYGSSRNKSKFIFVLLKGNVPS